MSFLTFWGKIGRNYKHLASIEHFSKDWKGAQLRELRKMHAIVVVDDFEASPPLLAIETEQMHIRVVHTEKSWEQLRLLGRQKRRMRRLPIAIGALHKVEETTWRVIAEIGIDADKLRELHQKDQMEVTVMLRSRIQPAKRILYIII